MPVKWIYGNKMKLMRAILITAA